MHTYETVKIKLKNFYPNIQNFLISHKIFYIYLQIKWFLDFSHHGGILLKYSMGVIFTMKNNGSHITLLEIHNLHLEVTILMETRNYKIENWCVY